jgi:hypothetical protein
VPLPRDENRPGRYISACSLDSGAWEISLVESRGGRQKEKRQCRISATLRIHSLASRRSFRFWTHRVIPTAKTGDSKIDGHAVTPRLSGRLCRTQNPAGDIHHRGCWVIADTGRRRGTRPGLLSKLQTFMYLRQRTRRNSNSQPSDPESATHTNQQRQRHSAGLHRGTERRSRTFPPFISYKAGTNCPPNCPRPHAYKARKLEAKVGILLFVMMLEPTGCGPKKRCVKEFLLVDYPNGQPDTVYATHCTPLNVP